MSDRELPPHLRRARLARRSQLVLAILAAAFVLYRLAAGLMRRAPR